MRLLVALVLGGAFLVACGPRKEMVFVCVDPERCKEQEPLCDNSCDYSIDRSACRACCRETRRKCDSCEHPHDFGSCK